MHLSRPLLVRCTVLGILIAGFLIVDFALPFFFPRDRPDMLGAVLLGSYIGQINLIAVWAALTQGNFVVRLPWSGLLGTMMWYAFIVGVRTLHPRFAFSLNDAVLLGMFLLVGIAIAQIPLWIARVVFRWQLIDRNATACPPSHGRLQFSVQQMLVATAILSMALAPLRTILPPGSLGKPFFEAGLFVLFATVAMCNFLATMPCIWGTMCSVSKLIRLGIGWLLYCGLLTAAEFGTLVTLLGPPSSSEGPFAVGLFFYVLNVSQCATVFGSLLLLRALGFQLVRVVRRETVQE
jgi:hypothetical protein